MENKINVAELLKDCPKGMELDCTLFEGLEFDSIVDNEYLPIRCRVKNPNGGYNVYNFTKYGCWFDTTFAKCVIFPKGKTTWEGFVPPCQFKDGDVLAEDSCIFIIQKIGDNYTAAKTHCTLYNDGDFDDGSILYFDIDSTKLATEEEKEKLFQAIKDNGYKWNPETKTLEKLIVPKFKVGDRIRRKGEISTYAISDVNDAHYFCGEYVICDTCDDDWELVPNKFDITTLKPFDKVLVRDSDKHIWCASIFSHTWRNLYYCAGLWNNQCIPYEGNEHLLGTTDYCDDFYKIWK